MTSVEGASWPLSCDAGQFEALLFDLDGTLVDTMPMHGKAYADVFATRGYRLSMADYLAHVGPPARVAVPLFMAAAGMRDITDEVAGAVHREKQLRFAELLATEAVPTLPASQLLARFQGEKPMALVSSGNRGGVDAIIAALGWADYFGAVVTGDDVTRGKPDPEPYLRAAALLGVAPGQCLAFEDTESGVSAAVAAGMSVIDLTRPGVLRPAKPGE